MILRLPSSRSSRLPRLSYCAENLAHGVFSFDDGELSTGVDVFSSGGFVADVIVIVSFFKRKRMPLSNWPKDNNRVKLRHFLERSRTNSINDFIFRAGAYSDYLSGLSRPK